MRKLTILKTLVIVKSLKREELVTGYMFFEGMKTAFAPTIIFRGANEFFLGEIERSIYDSLCVIKRVLEYNSIVAGGDAVEFSL